MSWMCRCRGRRAARSVVCAIGGRRSVATRASMAAKGLVRPGGVARTHSMGPYRAGDGRSRGYWQQPGEARADGGRRMPGALTPWSGEATRVDGRMAGSRGAAIPRESGQDKHRRVSPAPGQGYASGGGGVVVDVVGGFCCCGEQQPKFKWGFFVRLRAGERESSPINEPREGGERRGQTRQSVGNGRGVFCRLACKSRNY